MGRDRAGMWSVAELGLVGGVTRVALVDHSPCSVLHGQMLPEAPLHASQDPLPRAVEATPDGPAEVPGEVPLADLRVVRHVLSLLGQRRLEATMLPQLGLHREL